MNAAIAVVDDDVQILDAVKLVLELVGWSVWTYTNGESFLNDLASGNMPHCLLMDPHLPGMNGVEIAQAIIKNRHVANIPILVLTARPNSPVIEQIVNTGAHSLMLKPVDADELIDRIQIALNTDEATQN